MCLDDYNFFRIVQAFDNIVDALIESNNFTNISVVKKDLALRGERVSQNNNSLINKLKHAQYWHRSMEKILKVEPC